VARTRGTKGSPFTQEERRNERVKKGAGNNDVKRKLAGTKNVHFQNYYEKKKKGYPEKKEKGGKDTRRRWFRHRT